MSLDRLLAGCRQPRFAVPDTVERLRVVFAVPRPLMDGARWCGPKAAVLPVLFQLRNFREVCCMQNTPPT